MKTDSLTFQRLLEVVSYNSETGLFTWNVRAGKFPAGSPAGGINDAGYLRIKIDGVNHRAHRLAWLYVHGSWPKNEIDHRDGDRLNNKIDNLRDVLMAVNNQNIRQAKKTSSTGLIGVSPNKKRFQARICLNGVRVHLGNFKTAEAANARYLAEKRLVHVGCTI